MHRLYERKNILRLIALTVLIIIAIAIGRYSGIFDPDKVTSFVKDSGILAPLTYILAYVLLTLMFVPGTPITIAAGYIFGGILGTAYTVIAAALSASAAFTVSR
ncbi:hypothetical protein GF345_06740, partial [Candidatus Woesearchaeota archaeon]|nr:hypothetical protein [Candidatus Woesearchaeota archaeon]